MKNTIVTVKSKSTTNQSVPVVIKVIEYRNGDNQIEERPLRRAYFFENFESRMPLEHAKSLVKNRPNEFFITDIEDKEVEEEVKNLIKTERERARGYINPLNGFEAKNKAGLASHIRNNFPDEWKEAGEDLDSFLSKYRS